MGNANVLIFLRGERGRQFKTILGLLIYNEFIQCTLTRTINQQLDRIGWLGGLFRILCFWVLNISLNIKNNKKCLKLNFSWCTIIRTWFQISKLIELLHFTNVIFIKYFDKKYHILFCNFFFFEFHIPDTCELKLLQWVGFPRNWVYMHILKAIYFILLLFK